MKRIFTASLVGILTCLVLITSMFSALADAPATAATVNGKSAQVGSTVEYTLFLESYQQDVVGIQMLFKFDPAMLELKDVNLDSFPGATLNANNDGDGMIYFNNSDINGIGFSKAKEIAKLTFSVKAAGTCDIEYLIQYLYDIDLVNIYDYSLTYNLTIDDVQVVATEPPVLADVNEIANKVQGSFDKGDFANNVEGTGSGVKPVATTSASSSSTNSTNNDANSGNTTLFVIGGIVVAALIVVVIIIVIKGKKS